MLCHAADGKTARDVLKWLDIQSYLAADHPIRRVASTYQKNIQLYYGAERVKNGAAMRRYSGRLSRNEESLLRKYNDLMGFVGGEE